MDPPTDPKPRDARGVAKKLPLRVPGGTVEDEEPVRAAERHPGRRQRRRLPLELLGQGDLGPAPDGEHAVVTPQLDAVAGALIDAEVRAGVCSTVGCRPRLR